MQQQLLLAASSPSLNYREERERYIDEFNRIQNQFGIAPDKAMANLRHWLDGLSMQGPSTIPAPFAVSSDDVYLRQLPKSDPRGIFAGRYVGDWCCQHPQDIASPCVWYGHKSPSSAFWVLERNGQIIGVSWVWRHRENLVLDSLELQKESYRKDKAEALLQKGATTVIGRLGIKLVWLGGGHGRKRANNSFSRRQFDTPALYYQTSNICSDDSKFVRLLAGR